MGYRLRLGKIDKAQADLFRHLPREERGWDDPQESPQDPDDSDYTPYYPFGHTQLYEIGKYYNLSPDLKDPFYTSFDVIREYESDFHIIGKEGLKAIIEDYRQMIIEGLEEDLNAEVPEHLQGEITKEDLLKRVLQEELDRWNKSFGLRMYYLDEKPEQSDGKITPCWNLKYAIFNLVHIYRTFDWENDYLIYSGW